VNDAERFKLLHGPYHAPTLRRGDRAVCLFRDADVVITSWSDAPTPWPRCQRANQKAGGGSGLLVNEELLRAIRSESSLAIQHWFGVCAEVVWRWRKAFGVTQWGTEGSQRLHQVVSERGASRIRGKKWPRSLVRRRAATRRQQGYGRWPSKNDWKPEELALLGTMPDDQLAERIGRTANGVRAKRTRLGILTFRNQCSPRN
jgi:hypothetical protein